MNNIKLPFYLFSFLVIFFLSCNSREQVSDLGSSERENNNNNFSWGAIKSKSIKGVKNYNFDSINLEKLNLIDSIFFKSTLENARSFRLYFPEPIIPGNLYYFEFFEKANCNLISVLHQDEDCCITLYYLTLDKISGEVKDTKLIATQGSDGNWKEIDKGIRVSQNDVRIIKIIEEETGDRVSKDSLIVNFHVNDNGDIIKSVIDSIRIM